MDYPFALTIVTEALMHHPFETGIRWRWALALLAAGLSGCSTMHVINRVDFPDATLNGHPVNFTLDTGASMTLITSAEADALGLETVYTMPGSVTSKGHMGFSLSEPAHLTIGQNSFTTELVVGNTPKNVALDSGLGERVDGVVGWPEIWSNILVFEGDHRKITAVTTLPPETAGWLKLKLHPFVQLGIETPLPNGDTGVLLVDTGSYFGVSLPPEQWKTWYAAHPNAPTAAMMYYTPGVGQVLTTEAWADEIKLGAFTLTDVPVHEANTAEMKIDAKHYAGTLGLYALSRLHMVVDGRRGNVYLSPLPPPGPYYSAFHRAGIKDDTEDNPRRGDWTIEGPVKLDLDNLYMYSSSMMEDAGNKKISNGDNKGALADLSKAIEIFPKNAGAIVRRAMVYESENDFTAAMADYTLAIATLPPREGAYQRLIMQARISELKDDMNGAITLYTTAINLDPKNFEAYFLRGVDRQVMGTLAEALADYDQAATLQTDNVALPLLYHEVLRRWMSGLKNDLAKDIATWDDPWSKNAGNYLNGTMSEAAFLAAADKSSPARVFDCKTYYLVGINHLLNRDVPGARDFWKKCLSTNAKSIAEYRFAKAALTQFGL